MSVQDYVNLAIHGHNPLVAEKVLEWAVNLNEEAKKLGAKGINVVGEIRKETSTIRRAGIIP